jgi:hypothetical protein
MSYNRILSRLEALEPEKVELGPWPPESGIGKILYDQLTEQGIEILPPPEGESRIIYLLKMGVRETFEDEL